MLAYNPRMKIVLNGESREVPATTSLAQLLEQSGYGARRVAVEVNRQIVPRSRHAAHGLTEAELLPLRLTHRIRERELGAAKHRRERRRPNALRPLSFDEQ